MFVSSKQIQEKDNTAVVEKVKESAHVVIILEHFI